MSTPDYYSYPRFVAEVKMGNAIKVTLGDPVATVSFLIGQYEVTVSPANPTFDLGLLLMPQDVINSPQLLALVQQNQLLVYLGDARLDVVNKYIFVSSSSSSSSSRSSCSSSSASSATAVHPDRGTIQYT